MFNSPQQSEQKVKRPALKIGLVAFNKHIQTELNQKLTLARTVIEGSEEQQAIFEELLKGSRHVVIEAVAGSGKSWTLLQYCFREPQSNVQAMTYHSLGFSAIRKAFGKVEVEQNKVLMILDSMTIPVTNDKDEKPVKWKIAKLVSIAKQYAVGDVKSELEKIVEHHDIDLDRFEDLIYHYTPIVLNKCKEQTAVIDFDDMVWLPRELGLKVPRFDVLMVDEFQDTNVSQQWLATEAVMGDGRLVVVGDKNQAIYGWRGADVTGFEKVRGWMNSTFRGSVVLPLTLTRRCPKAHVRLAQVVVPQIRAMDNAPEGSVKWMEEKQALDEMKPGDLVICRVNAELLGVAYKLLRRGTKAVVRGRDIGEGIVRLIDQAVKRSGSGLRGVLLETMIQAASELTDEAVKKFMAIPEGRGATRAANAQDRYECLVQLSDDAKDSYEVKRRVELLFADTEADGKTPKFAVTLGTVHRTKGLESNRVFVLRPDILEHPMARQKWQREQEKNLAYVAVTRAKFEGDDESKVGELIWVGGECPLFAGVEAGEIESIPEIGAGVDNEVATVEPTPEPKPIPLWQWED